MSASTRVGTAVAAGYVLGRFRKMRLALIVGSALANRNVRAAGMDLLRGKAGGPISSPLVDMGRSALVAAASSSMNRVSDRLHERSVALNGGEAEEDEERYDDESVDEDEYEVEEEEEPEDEYEDEEEEEPEDEYEDEEEEEPSRPSRRARAAAPGRA